MKQKIVIKLMLFFILLACMGPFLLKDKTGTPLITIDRIKWPQISLPKNFDFFSSNDDKLPNKNPIETELLSPIITKPSQDQKVVKIYSYQDKNGVLHYTNKIPNRGDYKTIYVPVEKTNQKNIFLKIKQKLIYLTQKLKPEKKVSLPPSPTNSTDLSPPAIYTNPKQVIDNAMELKKQVEKNYNEKVQTLKKLDK